MQREGGWNPTPAELSAGNEGTPTDESTFSPAVGVAARAETTWRRIDATLSPIIGPMGMAALFKRSLQLASGSQLSLAAVPIPTSGADPYVSLRDVLSLQTEPAASDAQAVLLHTFQNLVASLIGDSLTERLLRSAAAFTPSGEAMQDFLP